jgi:NADH:ubiquinone oxidoreductase subunit H
LITHAEEIKHRVFIYMPFKPLFTSLLKWVNLVPVTQEHEISQLINSQLFCFQLSAVQIIQECWEEKWASIMNNDFPANGEKLF